MRSDKRQSGGRFFVKQAVLLVITIILLAFCTVPLIQAVRWALNPGELKANVEKANEGTASIRIKLDVANSRMLMGAGDDEAQEKLKKQVEELKRQVEFKELENKYLQNQIVLAQTIAELAKLKSSPGPTPVADTGQKVDSGQRVDKLIETSQKVDKLVTETSQKVDKVVATGKNVTELLIKLFGSLGSVFAGATFVVSWLRKRREPPQAAGQVASK